MSTYSLISTIKEKESDLCFNSVEQLLEIDDVETYLCNPKLYSKFYQMFDSNFIKKLIDYALKVPENQDYLDIYSISNTKDQTFYNKLYKYPYLSSEILSQAFPFIYEKIFPSINNNLNNFSCQDTILYEISMANNSVNDDLININNVVSDDVIDDNALFSSKEKRINNFNFNPPEIEYSFDKDISLNASLDKKSTIPNQINDYNYEIIDYIFNIVMNNTKLNCVVGSYLVKIFQNFMAVTSGNKGNLFIKYICIKKKEYLTFIMNNVYYDHYRKILLEILLYDSNNFDDNVNYESIKKDILNYLINFFNTDYKINNLELDVSNSYNSNNNSLDNNKDDLIYNEYGFFYKEISQILCEYIEKCKNNYEIVTNENFIKIYSSNFLNLSKYNFVFTEENQINNKKIYSIYEYLYTISSSIIKDYKNEYDKAQKFLTSLSKSHMKNTEKLVDKTLILNLDVDNLICLKMTNSLDNISNFYNINSFEHIPKQFIIHFLEFIQNLLEITRNSTLLEILIKEKFFITSTYLFFNCKNDIFQNYYIAIIKILIDENNEIWLYNTLIASNFLNKCMDTNYLNNKLLFIHISSIFEQLQNNLLLLKNMLIKYNYYDLVNETYKNFFSDYIEKMNKPLANFRNTFLYMSSIENKNNESDEINNVDEIDLENKVINNDIVINNCNDNKNLKENNYINKIDEIDDDDNHSINNLLLDKIGNEDEENENFYYDNNFWHHPMGNINISIEDIQ